jgi:hypothetical protein
MENNILMENQPVNEAPKRPQFITVLCILTFIGSGLAFIGAIWGYFSVKASAAMLESMGTMEGGDSLGMMGGMQETMLKAVENAVPNMIIGVVCSLICFYGALQMWKLKKIGFFIYSVGEITPAIAGFILGAGGMLGSMGAIVGLLFAIVWIVLYAVNLKHMK